MTIRTILHVYPYVVDVLTCLYSENYCCATKDVIIIPLQGLDDGNSLKGGEKDKFLNRNNKEIGLNGDVEMTAYTDKPLQNGQPV